MSAVRFQSTLPRGERLGSFSGPSNYLYFNPRSREGSDFVASKNISSDAPISIHAPARGATTGQGIKGSVKLTFQSTLPRGERLGSFSGPSNYLYFNPRSREGSDFVASKNISSDAPISIHAPARGATTGQGIKGSVKLTFQSTLPRGERH